LKLEDARHKNNNLLPGEMIMRFWTEDTTSAGSAATAAARQAVANGLESGNSATKSLETVVSKLKLFVSIADEAAQVRYIILSSVLVIYFFHYSDTPLRQHRLESDYNHISGKNGFPCTRTYDDVVLQIVKDQLDRDQSVVDLMNAMERVYSFVDEIQSVPDKINTLEKIIDSILQQTFDCAMFIQEYAGCGFTSAWSAANAELSTEASLLQRKHSRRR